MMKAIQFDMWKAQKQAVQKLAERYVVLCHGRDTMVRGGCNFLGGRSPNLTKVLPDPMASQFKGVMEVKQGLGFVIGTRGNVPLVPSSLGLCMYGLVPHHLLLQ
jgi:hypothetical protein